jgi:hypothetical protein
MGDKQIPKRTRGPILVTYRKISELAVYREESLKAKGMPPLLTNACRRIGIDHRTVRRYAPQLIEKWKEGDFHW